MANAPSPPPDQPTETSDALKKLIPKHSRILVIDDESGVQLLFQEVLCGDEYAVDVASTGEEALEMIRTTIYDLLIIDKNLPGISGLEVLYEARQLQPHIECIMITAYPSYDSKVMALLKYGAFDYMEKPFGNVIFLRQRIQLALEKRHIASHNLKLAASLKETQDDLTRLRQRIETSDVDKEMLNIYVTEMVNRACIEMQYKVCDLVGSIKQLKLRLDTIKSELATLAPSLSDHPGFAELTRLVEQAHFIATQKADYPVELDP